MKFDDNSLYNIQSSLEGERRSLFELANWKNGLAFKKIHFSDVGVPVIKIAELNNGIGATTAYTQQVFSEDVHLHKGDLLFSWSGNPQTSIDIFRFNLKEGWLNQHIFKVTPNEDLIDKDYFYLLDEIKKEISLRMALIIIITKKYNEDDVVNGLEKGACDYVQKPVGQNELNARIKNALRFYIDV